MSGRAAIQALSAQGGTPIAFEPGQAGSLYGLNSVFEGLWLPVAATDAQRRYSISDTTVVHLNPPVGSEIARLRLIADDINFLDDFTTDNPARVGATGGERGWPLFAKALTPPEGWTVAICDASGVPRLDLFRAVCRNQGGTATLIALFYAKP